MANVPQFRIEYMDTDSLIPYARNAKIHTDEQVRQIADSMEAFGFNDPVGVWTRADGKVEIVEGHGRVMAAKLLGIDKVPVIRLDHMTDDERRAYVHVHNQTTLSSGFDMEALKLDLDGIQIDTSPWFEGRDLSWAVGKEQVEETEVPEDVEPRAKRGDVWQLGRHRVMCGDSTSEDDVAVLMDGNRADLLLTDPPYGVKIVQTGHATGSKNPNEPFKKGTVRGGSPNEPFKKGTVGGAKPFGKGSAHGYAKNAKIPQPRIYREIIGDDTTETAKRNYNIMRESTDVQIIFGGNYFTDFLPPSRCWIVWDKRVPRESFFAQVELAWVSKDGNAIKYEHLWSGLCREGSREIELAARVHPTQKPVGLFASIIEDFTDESGTVVDCFGGSGTTLIAAEQTSRTCYMMELDPHYVDVIITRWETLTGQTAELLNTSEPAAR